MKRNGMGKLFFISALLWFSTATYAIPQTPARDLDSITEDSYQRMLARQAAERKSDSLIPSQSVPVLTTVQKEWEWWYVLLVAEIMVVMLLVLSRGRKKSPPEDRLKK